MLALHRSGETMEDVVERHGIKGGRGVWDRLQDVGYLYGRVITMQTLCRPMQTVRIEVPQGKAWGAGREAALIEIIAGAHAALKVVRGDMLVIEAQRERRR